MKTPDEIKKGLEKCIGIASCNSCDYQDKAVRFPFCAQHLMTDAKAYIQQLEAERDALIDALKTVDVDCEYCKHRGQHDKECEMASFECGNCTAIQECCCCGCTNANNHWEWLGPESGE